MTLGFLTAWISVHIYNVSIDVGIEGSIAREQEMLDSWKEIIGFTDCDDVQA